MEYTVRPIAYIRNERSEAIDDNWGDVVSTVELARDVPGDALIGLDEFSHVEIVFFADWADDVPPAAWHRRPRGNEKWPDIGVFAQRNKDRTVRGLDGIDGTPVLDIKPVFRWSRPDGELRVPAWSEELGENYF